MSKQITPKGPAGPQPVRHSAGLDNDTTLYVLAGTVILPSCFAVFLRLTDSHYSDNPAGFIVFPLILIGIIGILIYLSSAARLQTPSIADRRRRLGISIAALAVGLSSLVFF